MLLAEMDRTHTKMMCRLTRMPMMDANMRGNNSLASSIKPKRRSLDWLCVLLGEFSGYVRQIFSCQKCRSGTQTVTAKVRCVENVRPMHCKAPVLTQGELRPD